MFGGYWFYDWLWFLFCGCWYNTDSCRFVGDFVGFSGMVGFGDLVGLLRSVVFFVLAMLLASSLYFHVVLSCGCLVLRFFG